MATKKSLPQESQSYSPKRRKKNPHGTGVVEKKVVDRNGNVKIYRYVRVRYLGADGEMHVKQSPYEGNAKDARDVRADLKNRLRTHGEKSLNHWNATFNQLADYYEEKYLVPATYVDGKKISGRRYLSAPTSQLRGLRQMLGAMKCRSITYEVCRDVRITLLRTPTRPTRAEPNGHQRSMVDVDRRMQLLRHILKVGRRAGYLTHEPFADAQEPLITPAHEKKRRRIMSLDEEDALLEQCVDQVVTGTAKNGRRFEAKCERAHVRIVIIGLVDTLMRPGEFFKLRASDANFDLRRATVQQMNTKTLSERAAPISSRFARELRVWLDQHPSKQDGYVFPFRGIKRAWSGVKKAAGVTDLRLRDLRRTGATRLLRSGKIPIEEISRILGHTTIEMTYEYIGVDKDTTSRAADIWDEMHERREKTETAVN